MHPEHGGRKDFIDPAGQIFTSKMTAKMLS